MKGVTVNQLRKAVSAILAKVSQLLQTEPARAIGYGAAVVVYLVARVLSDRGYVQFNLSFEDSIIAAAAALTLVAGVVESIRRFVYSPQTYIEDLADEFELAIQQGHFEAHAEDAMRAAFEEAMRAAEAEASQPSTRTVTVGTAKADGTGDKVN